jgi:putative transposase
VSRGIRAVIPLIPHHVTQRGGRRQDVFFTEGDRSVYMHLLTHYARRYDLELLAYTLMTNHVHHLVVPHEKDSLRWTFQVTHKRYSEYVNARHQWTGHLWQARFFSSPVDESYFWDALRYIYRNPVEAKLVLHPSEYQWSSAAAHCGTGEDPHIVTTGRHGVRIANKSDFSKWLESGPDPERVNQLRRCTRRDLPTGSQQFLDTLERDHGVRAHPPKVGRPKKEGKS